MYITSSRLCDVIVSYIYVFTKYKNNNNSNVRNEIENIVLRDTLEKYDVIFI